MKKSDKDTLEQYPYVVVEQYPYKDITGVRIAAFCVRYEAELFCKAMNGAQPNRDRPYVVRKVGRK